MFHLATNPDAAYMINSSTAANQSNFYPKLWYWFDEDDANTPTLSDAKEKQGVKVKVLRPNSIIRYTIRPKPLLQVYNGVTAGYANGGKQWLDLANTGIQHYALKCVVDFEGAIPGNYYFVKVEYRYTVAMRGVR